MIKPQDAVYILILGMLLFVRKPTILYIAGCMCLIAAIPLFATWTFFTAERLTWYAASFFLFGLLLPLHKESVH